MRKNLRHFGFGLLAVFIGLVMTTGNVYAVDPDDRNDCPPWPTKCILNQNCTIASTDPPAPRIVSDTNRCLNEGYFTKESRLNPNTTQIRGISPVVWPENRYQDSIDAALGNGPDLWVYPSQSDEGRPAPAEWFIFQHYMMLIRPDVLMGTNGDTRSSNLNRVVRANQMAVGSAFIIDTMMGMDPATLGCGSAASPPNTNVALGDTCLSRGRANAETYLCGGPCPTLQQILNTQTSINDYSMINGPWAQIVRQYQANGDVEWNRLMYQSADEINASNAGEDYGCFGDPSCPRDVVMWRQGVTGNFHGIVFRSTNGDYIINRQCANAKGFVPLTDTDFTVTPTAANPQLNDPENPTSVIFRTGVDVNPGPIITNTRRSYYIKRYSAGTTNIANIDVNNFTYPDGATNYNDTRGVSGLNPGDQICATMRVDDAAGTADPSGNVTTRTRGPLTSAEACTVVVAKPYVKVFGNDVLAGAGLTNSSGSCNLVNNKATLLALNKETRGGGGGTTDVFTGTGTQLAAYALGEISQFNTAIGNAQRRRDQTQPSAPTGLTFGNYGTPSIARAGTNWDSSGLVVDANSIDGYGGKGSTSHCMPDYYNIVVNDAASTIDSTSTNVTINGQNSVPAAIAYTHTNTTVNLRTNSTALTGRHVLAVNGDVYITGNGFSYAPYANVGGIPSLYVIASGNVYIDPSVGNLAGVYVAQVNGNPATTGIISTCARPTGGVGSPIATVAYDQIFTACNRQLAVRGSFIAEHIHFVRASGSLKNSNGGEVYNFNNASEVFITSPEMYLSVPSVFRTSSPFGTYDSITSLPPVL